MEATANGPVVGLSGHGCGRGSTPMGSHFGVGEFTTHFRTYFSGDWDVHWGYGGLTIIAMCQMGKPLARWGLPSFGLFGNGALDFIT